MKNLEVFSEQIHSITQNAHAQPFDNNLLTDVTALQKALLQKDIRISALQGIINTLQLTNKQCKSYQEAMIQYEQIAQKAQSQLLKVSEQLRNKTIQCEQLQSKITMQTKQRKEKVGYFVKHQQYTKISNQYKQLKQTHKNCANTIKIHTTTQQQLERSLSELKQQIQSCNSIITLKNAELDTLKKQYTKIKTIPNNIQNKSQISNSRHHKISSLRIVNDQNNSSIIVDSINQISKTNCQLTMYRKQNVQLKNTLHKLQQQLQQYIHSDSEWSIYKKNNQHAKIIQEYERSLKQMGNKLTNVHKLQMQKNAIEQQKRKLQTLCEDLRQQLSKKTRYCQTLQKQIRKIQQYKQGNMQADIQGFHIRSKKLTQTIEQLQQKIKQKYSQVIELTQKYYSIKLNQSSLQHLQQSLNALQQKLKLKQQQLSKQHQKVIEEQQKYCKLNKQCKKLSIQLVQTKSQIAKCNRIVSQKVQKIQFQSFQIKRLQKQCSQKNQLSKKISQFQQQIKKLSHQYSSSLDESNQLAMIVIVMSAQIQRRVKTANISKQFNQLFQNLAQKCEQTEIQLNYLVDRIQRVGNLHKKIVKEVNKVAQHLQASHKRWNHYDKAIEKLIKFLQSTKNKTTKKSQQIDSDIAEWLKLQDQRLKQLEKLDQLGKIIGINAKQTENTVTVPLALSPKSKNN